MKLAVELHGTVVGHLQGKDARGFDFLFDDTARERFGTTVARCRWQFR